MEDSPGIRQPSGTGNRCIRKKYISDECISHRLHYKGGNIIMACRSILTVDCSSLELKNALDLTQEAGLLGQQISIRSIRSFSRPHPHGAAAGLPQSTLASPESDPAEHAGLPHPGAALGPQLSGDGNYGSHDSTHRRCPLVATVGSPGKPDGGRHIPHTCGDIGKAVPGQAASIRPSGLLPGFRTGKKLSGL